MPKAPKTIFICQSCDFESPRWSGQCPQCSQWNSLVETPSVAARHWRASGKALPLSKIKTDASKRLTTNISEFDRVLGGPPRLAPRGPLRREASGVEAGGIVPGSVILLAGEPGVGKSTLLLQVASSLPSKPSSASVLYVSGEESPSQIKLRADRLGLATENIQVLAETDVDSIIHAIENRGRKTEDRIEDRKLKGDRNQSSVLSHRSRLPSSDIPLLIVDSVQTLTTADLSAPAGSISQVREATYQLAQKAKETGIPVILVGHVTKEGSIAGPKVLEHLVDVVLSLEGDRFHQLRLLRTPKNRFGSTDEVGVFKMTEKGLVEVKNPSDAFLSERLQNASGSVVTATMEGTRPVLVEIQALTTATSLAYPRRTASGFDYNRLNLLVAVLQKHLNLPLQNKDIYVNVASGLKVTEPAADLAVCAALISSVGDQPVNPRICVFGEVGLSGEVRRVPQIERRTKEAKKLGFSRIISPESVRSVGEAIKKLKVES